MTHFAHFARIFAHLAEYRNTLMIEAQEYGWPLIRQMVRKGQLKCLNGCFFLENLSIVNKYY